MGSGDEFRFCAKDKVELMSLLKEFFYKNDCVLCVWARYCLFILIGLAVGLAVDPKVITVFASTVLFLMCVFAVLSWID